MYEQRGEVPGRLQRRPAAADSRLEAEGLDHRAADRVGDRHRPARNEFFQLLLLTTRSRLEVTCNSNESGFHASSRSELQTIINDSTIGTRRKIH